MSLLRALVKALANALSEQRMCILSLATILAMTSWTQAQERTPGGIPLGNFRENAKALAVFACSYVGVVGDLYQPEQSIYYRLRWDEASTGTLKVRGQCGIKINPQGKPDGGKTFTMEFHEAELVSALQKGEPAVLAGKVGEFDFEFSFVARNNAQDRLVYDLQNMVFFNGVSEEDSKFLKAVNYLETVILGKRALSALGLGFNPEACHWADAAAAKDIRLVSAGTRSGMAHNLWTNSRGVTLVTAQSLPAQNWRGVGLLGGDGVGDSGGLADFVMFPRGQEHVGCSAYSNSDTKYMSELECRDRIQRRGI